MAPRNVVSLPGFIGLLLSALLLVACGNGRTPAEPGPVRVTVATLQTQPITLTRELPGRVNPVLIAEVRPQVNGIIQRRLFTEGSTVEAGQPLYQLDDAIYRADAASARASLARAEAGLHTARLGARRADELVRSGAVSREQHDNAMAALREAEADVEVAEAAVQSRAILLGYSRILAPASGRIGRSSVTRGALVTANQAAALATVQQLDPVYVDLTQASSEWLQLRRQLAAGRLLEADNVAVTILLEDGSRYPHDGELAFADVSVDPTTGGFLLRAVVPNPDHMLLPGMYVRAFINTGRLENALLVPQQGITRDPKGNATAMIVGAGDKAERREVRVSRAIGDQWLIAGGLTAGDRVIVSGLQKIRPGTRVDAVEAAPPGAGPGIDADAGPDAGAPGSAASRSGSKASSGSKANMPAASALAAAPVTAADERER